MARVVRHASHRSTRGRATSSIGDARGRRRLRHRAADSHRSESLVIFALRPGQHLFDIVEAADQAGTEVNCASLEALSRRSPILERIEACPQHVVDDLLEWCPAPALLAFDT